MKEISYSSARPVTSTATLSPTPVGEIDFDLYEKVSGNRRITSPAKGLSREMKSRVEKALPCPHNPDSMSKLFLEGQSKLKMEVEVAKKSKHFLILNNNRHGRLKAFSKIQKDTCLIEQNVRVESPNLSLLNGD